RGSRAAQSLARAARGGEVRDDRARGQLEALSVTSLRFDVCGSGRLNARGAAPESGTAPRACDLFRYFVTLPVRDYAVTQPVKMFMITSSTFCCVLIS